MTTTTNAAKNTALITGASSGIGQAFATLFAEDGYNLVLAARSVAKMEVLAADLQKRYNINVTVIGADLEASNGAQQLHAAVKQHGLTISALVNNAGIGVYKDFKDYDLQDDLGMMQLNVVSLVALSKLFMPDLIATKGKLLNVASVAAFMPAPHMAIYHASKAFVLYFGEALASELRPHGVTVNTLCPGPTSTGFSAKADMLDSGLFKDKKLPTAEQVAEAGYKALNRRQVVFIPGVMNWLLAQSPRFGPRRVVVEITKMVAKAK